MPVVLTPAVETALSYAADTLAALSLDALATDPKWTEGGFGVFLSDVYSTTVLDADNLEDRAAMLLQAAKLGDRTRAQTFRNDLVKELRATLEFAQTGAGPLLNSTKSILATGTSINWDFADSSKYLSSILKQAGRRETEEWLRSLTGGACRAVVKNMLSEELVKKWVHQNISNQEKEYQRNRDLYGLQLMEDWDEGLLEEVRRLFREGHPWLVEQLYRFDFLCDYEEILKLSQGDFLSSEKSLFSLSQLNNLFLRLEKWGVDVAHDPRLTEVRNYWARKEIFLSDDSPFTISNSEATDVADHPFFCLLEVIESVNSADELFSLMELSLSEIQNRWLAIFPDTNEKDQQRMRLVHQTNPNGNLYPYSKMVAAAHRGAETYRLLLDSFPQNQFVASRLKEYGVNPEQHRAGIGEQIRKGRESFLSAEEPRQIRVKKAVSAWNKIMEEGVLKKPEVLCAKVKDNVFKGQTIEMTDAEAVAKSLDENPERLRSFVQTILDYFVKQNGILNRNRVEEALLIFRTLQQDLKKKQSRKVSPKELTVTLKVEAKHPVHDLTIGNESGCCIGVYLDKEEEEEGLSNGIYMPFYLADDATHFVGIYIGGERVGMVLVFDGEWEGKPAMLINSVELGGKFGDNDSRIGVIVRAAHEYVVEWGIRDRMVVLESMHDYNTGFLYDRRGVYNPETGFGKFHCLSGGEFCSDALGSRGISVQKMRLLISVAPKQGDAETVSLDELLRAEEWNEEAILKKLRLMWAVQRRYAATEREASEIFRAAMQKRSERLMGMIEKIILFQD